MVTLKIDGGDTTEVIADSFVWLRYDKRTTGNLYIDFCTLPAADRDTILKIRNKILYLTEELADCLRTLSP